MPYIKILTVAYTTQYEIINWRGVQKNMFANNVDQHETCGTTTRYRHSEQTIIIFL